MPARPIFGRSSTIAGLLRTSCLIAPMASCAFALLTASGFAQGGAVGRGAAVRRRRIAGRVRQPTLTARAPSGLFRRPALGVIVMTAAVLAFSPAMAQQTGGNGGGTATNGGAGVGGSTNATTFPLANPSTGGAGAIGGGACNGTGGVGVFFATGTIGTLTNSGITQGGAGGAGGAAGSANGVAGLKGGGGVGVVGSNLTVVNSGTVTGGLDGDGVTRANAITFTGGANFITFSNAISGITGDIGVAGQLSGHADAQRQPGDGRRFDLSGRGPGRGGRPDHRHGHGVTRRDVADRAAGRRLYLQQPLHTALGGRRALGNLHTPVDTTGSFGNGVTTTVTYTANEVQLTLNPKPLAPIVLP